MARKTLQVRGNYREIASEYFCGTDGKPYRLADFHVEILEAMFAGGNLVVNVPTDHMKSSLGGFLFPLLSLMDDPNESHIVCGSNINDSRRRVQAIEREIETNTALTRDFPQLRRPEEKEGRLWAATQFNVAGRTVNKPNPSVYASAIGANDLKGRRGKLIMDDIEGEDARWSPMKREQLYGWLKLEAWRCYEDRMESERPLLCLLGTPFDVDSIYFRVEAQGWKVIRYPVFTFEGYRTNVRKDGTTDRQFHRDYLWPEKEEKVRKAEHTLRKLEFAVAYRMDPTGGDPSRVSAAQITKAMSEAPEIQNEYSGFITLDPASGSSGPKADYAGLAVVKLRWPQGDELPECEVLEAYNFSQGLFEQVHLCAALHDQYGFPVLYERNSQQGGTYANSFQHLHPHVPLLTHYTTHASKFDVSMGMTVVRRIAVDRKLFVRPEVMETDGVVQLIQEIRDLQPPFKTHNHICAAIWFAVRYAYEKVRHYKGPSIRTTYAPLDPRKGHDIWPGAKPAYTPSVVSMYGFGNVTGQQSVAQRAMREEVERFERARRGPEAIRREQAAVARAYQRRMRQT